jgi:hypothetical protein
MRWTATGEHGGTEAVKTRTRDRGVVGSAVMVQAQEGAHVNTAAHAVAGRRTASRAAALQGITLVEVVLSLLIVTIVFSGIITAYIQATRKAEWSGYSLAAQAFGIHQIEQARAAVWDYSISKNELTNLTLSSWTYNTSSKTGTGYTTGTLDLPIAGTNITVATNFVTVKLYNVTGVSNVQVQMVMVDTVWPFPTRTGPRLFTNRTASYFGPDNRDISSL